MKYEVWLRSNWRAALLLTAPWLLIAGLFALGTLALWNTTWGWLMLASMLLSLGAWGITFRLLRLPRIAYERGELLFFLIGVRPMRVPVEIVECAFLGQGPSMLPPPLEGKKGEASETSTVVIRLAESAKEWHHRDVHAFLGQWCEGYITIRGTWSERLTPEVVGRFNQRLVEAHRATRAARKETVTA